MKKPSILLFALLISSLAFAQTPTDMEFVPKGNICAGLGYTYDSWNQYWQGDSIISNGNVGTVTHQTMGLGANVGILDRLNVIVMVPYMFSNASQGTLNGQSGFSDIAIDVKGKYGEWDLGPGKLLLAGDIGFSTPISHYLIDFAPLNLGLGTTNLLYRQLITYKLNKGFYIHARGAYTFRSDVPDIHRDYYYNDGSSYYTNKVQMEDMFDWAAALGYKNTKLLAEISYINSYTLGGTNIRTWDPGFCSNEMNRSVIQGRFDYYFDKPKGLMITARAGYTVDGRNVGQSWYGNIGVDYLFPVWGKKHGEQKPVE